MSTLTKAYQKNWEKKLLEKGRSESQKRVYLTLSRLFDDIINEKFEGNILDLGCGDSALVNYLNTTENIMAKGIDINQGINFENDKLPFEKEEFDIIIMYSVIEHLHNPGNILNEIKRILKPKGKIIIITSNFDLEHFFICDKKFYNDPTHVQPYNYTSIELLMKIYNFRKRFIGLWTVNKSSIIWKLTPLIQFYIGALLPFSGQTKFMPSFLKGKSKSMLCVFENNS